MTTKMSIIDQFLLSFRVKDIIVANYRNHRKIIKNHFSMKNFFDSQMNSNLVRSKIHKNPRKILASNDRKDTLRCKLSNNRFENQIRNHFTNELVIERSLLKSKCFDLNDFFEESEKFIGIYRVMAVFEKNFHLMAPFVTEMLPKVYVRRTGAFKISWTLADLLILEAKKLGFPAIHQSFNSYDVDGSGSINEKELADWLKHFGRALEPPQIRRLIAAVDRNKSGVLEFDECLRLVCKRVLILKATQIPAY